MRSPLVKTCVCPPGPCSLRRSHPTIVTPVLFILFSHLCYALFFSPFFLHFFTLTDVREKDEIATAEQDSVSPIRLTCELSQWCLEMRRGLYHLVFLSLNHKIFKFKFCFSYFKAQSFLQICEFKYFFLFTLIQKLNLIKFEGRSCLVIKRN